MNTILIVKNGRTDQLLVTGSFFPKTELAMNTFPPCF